jgi:3-oxoacyl-[acyl-carrier-protein] synthase II
MAKRRVVITGLASLKAGRSGISPIQSFDTSGFAHCLGGEVKDFAPHDWLQRIDPDNYGRTSQFAAAAARMAIEDADIDAELLSRAVCGSIIGTTDGESRIIDRLTAEWVEQGPAHVTRSLARQHPANRLALAVSRELGLRGETLSVLTACAAGNYAIGHAFDLIQTGEADFMLCGGADSVNRKTYAGFYRIGAVAPLACQPFDKNRKGILPGEGAGILLLETLDHARARRARIYAEVLGYGLSCDANHMVALNPKGITNCIRRAHQNAGVIPRQIDYISAHGRSTISLLTARPQP